jgi:hypothetical protein
MWLAETGDAAELLDEWSWAGGDEQDAATVALGGGDDWWAELAAALEWWRGREDALRQSSRSLAWRRFSPIMPGPSDFRGGRWAAALAP